MYILIHIFRCHFIVCLHVDVQLSALFVGKNYPFSIGLSKLLCQRLVDNIYVGLYLVSVHCYIDLFVCLHQYHAILITAAL